MQREENRGKRKSVGASHREDLRIVRVKNADAEINRNLKNLIITTRNQKKMVQLGTVGS